jgi:hypothetical protein
VDARRRGSCVSAAASPSPNRRLRNDEGRFEGHGPGDVVEVGRGRHHRRVDLGELLLGAAALYVRDWHLADIATVFGDVRFRR